MWQQRLNKLNENKMKHKRDNNEGELRTKVDKQKKKKMKIIIIIMIINHSDVEIGRHCLFSYCLWRIREKTLWRTSFYFVSKNSFLLISEWGRSAMLWLSCSCIGEPSSTSQSESQKKSLWRLCVVSPPHTQKISRSWGLFARHPERQHWS